MKTKKMLKAALRRKYHIRKKIFGTPDRPRLTVFRSNRHIYAQIIDDTVGITLACASTKSKAMQGQIEQTGNRKAAEIVGEAVAKQALGVGIKCVCFDKNRYKYQGRIENLAKAARKAGLNF